MPSERASTLPRNYHVYSAPKPFNANASSFKQYRKTAFANKRNMWENMSQEKDAPQAPPAPPNLAALLQRDTSPNAYSSDAPQHNGLLSSHNPREASVSTQDSSSSVESSPRQEPSPRLRPWQAETKQANYKSVTAPVTKPWTKPAAQPNVLKQPIQPDRVQPKIVEPSHRSPATRYSNAVSLVVTAPVLSWICIHTGGRGSHNHWSTGWCKIRQHHPNVR